MYARISFFTLGVIGLLFAFFVSVTKADNITPSVEVKVEKEVKLPTFIHIFPNEKDNEKVMSYYYYLFKLKTYQLLNMLKAHEMGMDADMALILTAIVWKESGFGTHLSNTKDGEHGSFGIAQILLDTAIKRNNVKTKEAVNKLKHRLLTDSDFNLQQAIIELSYWMKVHEKLKANKEKYYRYVIASYNNGFNSYTNKKGKKYADDVVIRMKALKVFFMDPNKRVNKVLDGEIELISKYYR